MKRSLLIIITLAVGVIGGCALYSTKASAYSYDTSNLIDDSVYYNASSMTQSQIQNFINAFPQSCLLPQNYPSGLGQVTFKEPLDYSTYSGSDTSPARIIWDASQYYSINPQVILVTLEKEQNLVTGNAGCAVWKYNSAMGYNCPDGSENALKDYPNSGVYRTCVAKETNAGFARQVNHAAWQLSFDGKRSNGDLSWMGDGATPYYGRMTQGWRQQVNGAASIYYDGYTTIDGQSVYLSNGPTAALYNYTPHFNNFNLIFTSWFGSTHAAVNLVSDLSLSQDSLGKMYTGSRTASFTVQNSTDNTVDLGSIGVASLSPSGRTDGFAMKPVVLGPHARYTYTDTQAHFTEEGIYKFWIVSNTPTCSYCTDQPPSLTSNIVRSWNVYIQQAPTISQSLHALQTRPSEGANLTLAYTIRNNSSQPVSLGDMSAVFMTSDGRNVGMSLARNIVIPAYADQEVQVSNTLPSQGGYIARITNTKDGGVTWDDSFPGNNDQSIVRNISFTAKPGMTLQGTPALSTPSPRVGDSVSASFSIKNYMVNDVGSGSVGLAITDPSGRNVGMAMQNLTIPANGTFTYSVPPTVFTTPGTYTAWITQYKNNYWSDYNSIENSNVSNKFTFTVKPGATLQATPTLSNPSPHVGDSVSASFNIKNYTQSSVNDGAVGLAITDPNGKNVGMAMQNLSIPANGTFTYSVPSSVLTVPGVYTAWITQYKNNYWSTYSNIEDSSVNNKFTFTVKPGATLQATPTILPTSPHAGDAVSASFNIKNYTQSSINDGSVGLAITDPSGRNVGMAMQNLTIPANGTFTYSVPPTVFTTPGTYTAWITQYKNNYWSDYNSIENSNVSNKFTFTVN